MTKLEKLGIKIGHYTNKDALTGATVILPDNGANIGIDVRGSDTGTINIPAFEIKGSNKTVDAIVLTGGSTFGLECTIGVMDYLQSPSVVGAAIYDRHIGKDERPHIADGFKMAESAIYKNMSQGNIGVGTGATTGKWIWKNKLKGGFGFSIKEVSKNVFIGAFVVTNSMGDIINPVTKTFYSETGKYDLDNYCKRKFLSSKVDRGTNTTLGVIVTNIEMDRAELIKVSELAQDGMARAIYPVHTNWDGDVIFSISPHSKNSVKLNLSSFSLVNYVGIVASNVLINAINNSVKYAESVDGCPSFKEIYQ